MNKLKKMTEYIKTKLAALILFFVYMFAVIPTKIFMSIFKRDRLNLNNQNKETFWIDVKEENKNWDLQY